jgi:hypothetical protein
VRVRVTMQQVDDEMKKTQEKKKEMMASEVGTSVSSLHLDGGSSFISQHSQRSAAMSGVSNIDEEEMQEMETLREVLSKPHNRAGRLVCQLCYSVLYHMVHKHTVNSNYLAQYMTQIQDQLILELGAERLLLEMLADNESLLLSMASDATKEKHVTFHVRALTERGKNAMHLRFLSSMAAVGDRGISRHQDLVLPHLLTNERKILLDCFLDERKAVSLRDWYADLSGLPAGNHELGTICTRALRQGETGAMFKRMLDYFVESLLLLATLCKPDSAGRREFLVLKVRELLPLRTCILCLQSDSLPEHLRRNMCEFVRVVHVQDDTLNKVTLLAGVSIWNDLAAAESLPVATRAAGKGSDGEGGAEAGQDTGETETHIQDLKNTIRDYLAQNTCQYYPGRTPQSNPLKLSMIRLCRELVLYGHYAEAELHAVVKEACVILDFSSMRFIDESHFEVLGSLAKGQGDADKSNGDGVLTEHSVSLALQNLRSLCKDIAPIEIARFCSAFKCLVFETKQTIVNSGDSAADMFVIQSGAAFMIQNINGVDQVVATVGPGSVFGVDTLLARDKKTWPWKVRCSQRVTALHLKGSDLLAVQDQLARQGRLSMTDGLEVVLETKREACALINDIYDLRLAVRTGKLLQEYRFDLNISNKEYMRHMLSATDGGVQASSVMMQFPFRQDTEDMEIASDFFDRDDWPVLGPLSSSFEPLQTCFVGMLRIDRAVAMIALLQYVLASAITIMLALRLKNVLEGNDSPVLEPGAVAPASATVGMIPKPYTPNPNPQPLNSEGRTRRK